MFDIDNVLISFFFLYAIFFVFLMVKIIIVTSNLNKIENKGFKKKIDIDKTSKKINRIITKTTRVEKLFIFVVIFLFIFVVIFLFIFVQNIQVLQKICASILGGYMIFFSIRCFVRIKQIEKKIKK